jgi:exodeoxyribonuclease VII small subunit
MKNKELTYTDAIAEINAIIEKIERSEINVDTLNNDVERALELIKFCKLKLYATEKNINKILDDTELN